MTAASQDFCLHPQLAADTFFVTELPLCRVLLMNDSQFPWLIAVPRINGLRELDELTPAEYVQYGEESRQICAALRQLFRPDKLNLAALGNMVPQLHIHHVARFETDPAWPRPIWGAQPTTAYEDSARDERLTALRAALCG